MTSANLDDLLQVARLIKERELAALQRYNASIAKLGDAESELATEVTRQRSLLGAPFDGASHHPGAFEAWLRHVRRQEARLAAEREALSTSRAAQFARAQLAFGRVRALEDLAMRRQKAGRGAPGAGQGLPE